MQIATRTMTLFVLWEGMGCLKRMQLCSALSLQRLFALLKAPEVNIRREAILMLLARAPESQRMVKSFPTLLEYAQTIHDLYLPNFSSWG